MAVRLGAEGWELEQPTLMVPTSCILRLQPLALAGDDLACPPTCPTATLDAQASRASVPKPSKAASEKKADEQGKGGSTTKVDDKEPIATGAPAPAAAVPLPPPLRLISLAYGNAEMDFSWGREHCCDEC